MIIKRNKKNNQEHPKEESARPKEQKEEQVLEPKNDVLKDPFAAIKERQERRRGDRRRGYRRVDDRNLISRAQEEANTITDRAAKEGFNHGLQASQGEMEHLKDVIQEFIEAKETSMQMAANDIAFIAIKVAEKIIKTEVTCDETIVLSIISEVLNEVEKSESKIIIKVNPSDAGLVKENLPNIFPYGRTDAKILVVDDSTIELGSCSVETNNGIIDANFTTQLEILTKAFNSGL